MSGASADALVLQTLPMRTDIAMDNKRYLLSNALVASSYPFKAETTGRAHTDAGLGLHLHGRCGSAIDPSGYAASQT